MKKLMKVNGRLVRNIVFWSIALVFIWLLNDKADKYPRSVYNLFKLGTVTVLFLFTIVNNFVIAPRLLPRRKYFLYILAVAAEVFLFSCLYVLLLKIMVTYYPAIEVYEVSILTSYISDSWHIADILDEALGYTFALALWIIVFTMAWYMNEYRQQERKAAEALQRQTEMELSLMRHQLNPHFFFNTLNNVYGLILKKSDNAATSVLQLSSIMRYVLYESDKELMPFSKEKEVMQAYIEMELLRLNKKENLNFEISADRDYDVPPLLWLSVLENAFKYATRVIGDDYFINYRFVIENGALKIESTNSYKEQTNNNLNGIGLTNIRKRLEILYPDRHTIDINKSNGKYHCSITIQL